MKKYQIILLFLLMIVYDTKAQVLFQFPIADPFKVELKDVLNCTLNNLSTSALTGKVKYKLSCKSTGDLILQGEILNVNLNLGATILGAELFQGIYGPRFSKYVNTYEYFVPELYEFCVGFRTEPNGETEYSDCISFEVLKRFPPQLVYPENNASISTLQPLLSWTSPSPILPNEDIKYHLKMVELRNGQSLMDAMNLNLPIVGENNLSGNSLLYDISYQPLEYSKNYAWQIEAFIDKVSLGKTEIWRFTPLLDSIKVPVAGMGYYVRANNNQTGEFIQVKDDIRFELEENIELADINWIKIESIKAEEIKIVDKNLISKSSESRYVLPITSFNELKPGVIYNLLISHSKSVSVLKISFKIK